MKDENGQDVPPEPVPSDSEIDEEVRRVRRLWLVSDKGKQRRQAPGRSGSNGGRPVTVEIKRSPRPRGDRS
jgi:hypothetical protein